MKRGAQMVKRLYAVFFLSAIVSCRPSPVETEGVDFSLTQRRLAGESYDEAEARYRRGLDDLSLSAYMDSLSVKSLAQPLAVMDGSSIPEFADLGLLTKAFERVRDYRFLNSVSHPDVLRRSTWLYPDDGCFARADLAVQHLAAWKYTNVWKIFVFGELSVASENSVDGAVNWWFHVAPISQIDGNLYVLDPAIDPSKVLALTDWLDHMTEKRDDLLLSLCLGHAYNPYSRCLTPGEVDSGRALVDQESFLDLEWDRMVELGRDPSKDLGDFPPWL